MSLDNHAFQTNTSTEAAGTAPTRSWNAKRCPSCDTPVLYNQTVCAECGSRLTPRVTKVRCRQCGKRATSDHVICPHCGRALRAAPSRLLTIGAPLLLVGALTIAIVARAPTLPALLDPNASGNLSLLQNVVITPVPAATSEADTVAAANDSLAPIIINSPAGQAEASSPLALAEESTPLMMAQMNDVTIMQNPEVAPSTSEVESNQTPIPLPTETPRPPTPAPTETAIPTVETPPTPTSPSPTATSTPVADLRYTVKAGDTIIGIAQRFDISADILLVANALTERDASNLQIGQEIVLPGIKPNATPSATATATDIPLHSQHPNPSTQWTVYLEMVL